jgi:hypothetical protein
MVHRTDSNGTAKKMLLGFMGELIPLLDKYDIKIDIAPITNSEDEKGIDIWHGTYGFVEAEGEHMGVATARRMYNELLLDVNGGK